MHSSGYIEKCYMHTHIQCIYGYTFNFIWVNLKFIMFIMYVLLCFKSFYFILINSFYFYLLGKHNFWRQNLVRQYFDMFILRISYIIISQNIECHAVHKTHMYVKIDIVFVMHTCFTWKKLIIFNQFKIAFVVYYMILL